jgi:hypothetical protein
MSTADKKKTARGKRKPTKTNDTAPAPTIELDSSVIDTSASAQPTKAPRGTKRTSDQISGDDHRERESTVKPEPSAKRRNTKTPQSVVRDAESSILHSSMEQMDVSATLEKTVKKGRKRASSTTRKVSTAALRADIVLGAPDDAMIEAALEEDLNRPLSDEEQPTAAEAEKPKRGKSKKATATTRSRKGVVEEEQQADGADSIEQQETQAEMYETDMETKPKVRKPRATKKAIGKKTTRQYRASTECSAPIETNEPLPIGSVLTTRILEDDSGHETDASVTGKPISRKTSKRKGAGKVQGKAGPRIVSRNIELIIESQPESSAVGVLAAASESVPPLGAAVEADQMDIDEKIAELTREIDEEEAAQKKTGRPAKGTRVKAAKGEAKKERIPQLSMPGAFSPLVLESPEPSFASAISPTSPPIKSNLQRTIHEDGDMEVRSPDQQITPTPKRVAPPMIPPRSNARPTPTPISTRSAIPRPTTTPTRSVQNTHRDVMGFSEMSPSAQSSDAENAPPSSRPESVRPPLVPISPVKRVMLACPGTPTTARRIGIGMMSPSKIGGGLKSVVTWTSVDVEMVFQQDLSSGLEKENWFAAGGELTSPEKAMSVEEWIYENARRAEEELRKEGERVVSAFEEEGRRAMRVLEGVACE